MLTRPKKFSTDEDKPVLLTLDSKVWVPLRGRIVPGIVISQLILGGFIVLVRGKTFQFEADEVRPRLI